MREMTLSMPKPMVEVSGKPVLSYILEGLRDAPQIARAVVDQPNACARRHNVPFELGMPPTRLSIWQD